MNLCQLVFLWFSLVGPGLTNRKMTRKWSKFNPAQGSTSRYRTSGHPKQQFRESNLAEGIDTRRETSNRETHTKMQTGAVKRPARNTRRKKRPRNGTGRKRQTDRTRQQHEGGAVQHPNFWSGLASLTQANEEVITGHRPTPEEDNLWPAASQTVAHVHRNIGHMDLHNPGKRFTDQEVQQELLLDPEYSRRLSALLEEPLYYSGKRFTEQEIPEELLEDHEYARRLSALLEEPEDSRFLSTILILNNGTGQQRIILPPGSSVSNVFLEKPGAAKLRAPTNGRRKQVDKEMYDEQQDNDQTDPEELTDILSSLKKTYQVKTINVLRKRLEEKNALLRAEDLRKENDRLTRLGISLHKQAYVLDSLVGEGLVSRQEQVRELLSPDPSLDPKITEDKLDLLRREVGRGDWEDRVVDRLRPIRTILRYQEQRLLRGN